MTGKTTTDKTINGAAAIWRAPLAIAVVTATGLGAALLLEGPAAKASACVALAAPLAAIGYFAIRAIRRPGRT